MPFFVRQAKTFKSVADAPKNRAAGLRGDDKLKDAAAARAVRTGEFLLAIDQTLGRDDLTILSAAKGLLSPSEISDLAREATAMLSGDPR